jgi:hypothetical protein
MVPYDTFDQMRSNFQDTFKEMADRIAALELRVAQLEARPQPAQTISHGGMWAWPWGTQLSQMTGAIGTNVSRETSKGPNGAAGPIGSAENPLIVKDR